MSHHPGPAFFLFSQIPGLTETLDPESLKELLPGEEGVHPDLTGIRDDFIPRVPGLGHTCLLFLKISV